MMKAISWLVILGLIAPVVRAQQTNLTELLQQGMFEEQANHNMDAAISNYEVLSTQFDKDRQLAATAIFRLGECYREEGQTNQAAVEYRRILNEFSDQKTLVMLSRQDLVGMGAALSGAGEITGNPAATTGISSVHIWNMVKSLRRAELEKVLPTLVPDAILTSLLQQRNAAETGLAQRRTYSGPNDPDVMARKAALDAISLQIGQRIDGIMEALKLQNEAVQPGETAGSETSAPASDEDQEIARLQAMLQNSPDLINAPGDSSGGRPPLVAAAYSDHLRVAQFLLDHGADVNVQSGGNTPLTTAAASGHKTMVELLLSHGADINANSQSIFGGGTALCSAVDHGYTGVTETLIAAHAEMDAANNSGETPLFLAVKNGNTRIAQMLLAAGANPNIGNVLDRAAWISPEIVNILLAAGADANTTNNRGWTPLSNAAEFGTPEIVKALLGAKADPNGGTMSAPLLCAIDKQNKTTAELLLQAGANPNLQGLSDGDLRHVDHIATPLWAAVSLNQLPMVQLLLKYKADPNSSQINNTPVIFRAVDKTNVLEALLNAGANPNVTNDNGRTPLSLAAEDHSPAAVITLLAAKADPNGGTYGTPLTAAVHARDPVAVKLLLQAGADPNAKDSFNRSSKSPALLFGALYDTNVLTTMLDFRANPNVRNSDGWTPLMVIVSGDGNAIKTPTVAVLLKHGADANLGRSDFMPLHAAAYRLDEESVRLLLNYGANPNVRSDGATPLGIVEGIASGNGQIDGGPPSDQQKTIAASIADLLRQHGALKVLPDWEHITIRLSTKYSDAFFYKGTNDWNRFTLMELLSNFFHGSPFALGPLPFPDFSRITIVRPNAMGITHKRIPINLLNSTNGVDCSEDVPLDFGDVVEVPEREHTLAEDDTLTGKLTEEMSQCLKEKAGTASLIVDGGQTIQLPLNEFEPGDCSVQDLLGGDSAMRVLTSDSDLSHVKVTRGQKMWTIDCSRSPIPGRMPFRQTSFWSHDYSDLWVRDGDVIEVPETH